MHFTNIYYGYYQKLVFNKCMELEKAKKKREEEKAAQEEGELVEEALDGESDVIPEEELRLQHERKEKAHVFLRNIFNAKQNKNVNS